MTQPLLERLAQKFPTAKRTNLRQMIRDGRVTVLGNKAINAKQLVAEEDKVEVSAAPIARPPESNSLVCVVYEDADILVVNKPPGLLTSTVPREPRPTLVSAVWEYARSRDPRTRVGLIHRLDRDASGILVFSKNDLSYAHLKRQFFKHTVYREYQVVVAGIPNPPAGQIETRLIEHPDGTVHNTRQPGRGEVAITNYEVIKQVGERALVRVVLATGRKHQIRVQLSGRQTPVVGDNVYGPPGNEPHLLLAAVRLQVEHPRTGREMDFAIPTPDYFPKHFRMNAE